MKKLLKNKKAVSPLVATVLLVVFSLILGTVTMNLGKAYIDDISNNTQNQESTVKYIDNQPYECVELNELGKCTQWKAVS